MGNSGLNALFRPNSLAVIGASNDPNKVGGRPISFLLKANWSGKLLPVNPTAEMVQGLKSYASLDAIEGEIDQAIIAVPAGQVAASVAACIARRIKAIQIFSAGFGEGEHGATAVQQIKHLAASNEVRLLGPNSLGLFNAVDGFFGTFATALDGSWPKKGGVGVATQSGAFGSYFFGLAQKRGIGFSHFVATGNEADIDVADCINWMAADPETRIIVTALEGCRDGRKLNGALLAAKLAGKTVLAMKVGASDAGAKAAATHTGALSGADRVFASVFKNAGVFRARSLSLLTDAAYLATVGPMPSGRRLMVVTTSGGIGVLTADMAESENLMLPPIGDKALDDLRAIAPLADGRNPVDTSAGILGDLSAFARMAERALSDTECDAVLLFLAHVPRNPKHWAQLREPLLELRSRHPVKTFAVVALADESIQKDLEAHEIAVFSDPGAAVSAIAACTPCDIKNLDDSSKPQMFESLQIGAGPISERAAKAILSEAGINFPPEKVAHSPEDAIGFASEIGYPVVLKVVSPDIAHKTEVGGVVVGIGTAEELRQAFLAMDQRVRNSLPNARIEGYLISSHVKGGVEVLVGTQCDPVFGPVVTVGSGGVLAELNDDVCVRLAPVSEHAALEMLATTRVWRQLQGYRGSQPVDMNSLARQISIISNIAWRHSEEIEAMDVNPVLACVHGAYALDALIIPKAGHL